MNRPGITRASLLVAALGIAALVAGMAALARVRPTAVQARFFHLRPSIARNLRGTIVIATPGHRNEIRACDASSGKILWSIAGPTHKSGMQIACRTVVYRETWDVPTEAAMRDGAAAVARDLRSGKLLFRLIRNLDAQPSRRFGEATCEALDPGADLLIHVGADASTLWLREIRGPTCERRLFRSSELEEGDGGRTMTHRPLCGPRWSPGGDAVAFMRSAGPIEMELRLLRVNGRSVTLAGMTEEGVQGFCWNPDGTSLAVFGEGGEYERPSWWLGEYDLKSQRFRDIQPPFGGRGTIERIEFAPEGGQLAVVAAMDGKQSLWILSPNGGERRLLARGLAGVDPNVWCPDGWRVGIAWSPDGGRILYLAQAPGEGGNSGVLRCADAATGVISRLPIPDVPVLEAVWTR
jgi:hypothetical protein